MLCGGGFGSGGLHHSSLEGAEGNFIDEPLAAPWAAGFPSHKGAVCNHAQDGHAAVAKHGGGLLHRDSAWGGKGIYDGRFTRLCSVGASPRQAIDDLGVG